MIYFTSDWHLGETRIGDIRKGEPNFFFRDFSSTEEQDSHIIQKVNQYVGKDDILYHIGDVLMTDESYDWLDCVRCKNRTLITGNYDINRLSELAKYFDMIHTEAIPRDKETETEFHLVHEPTKSIPDMFNIVGHIHGLWKVKRNMINVGVDAWHFRPVSMAEILFTKDAIDKSFYDDNVFYGEAK